MILCSYLHLLLVMLRRLYQLVVGLYRDVDQQQGPYQLVLVEVAARQLRGPHLLLEVVAPYLVP